MPIRTLGTFADLAKTDQDLRDLQRFRQGEANQENDPTGQQAKCERELRPLTERETENGNGYGN
jgi:hypothetical protein